MAHNQTRTDGHGNSRTESAQWGRFSENANFLVLQLNEISFWQDLNNPPRFRIQGEPPEPDGEGQRGQKSESNMNNQEACFLNHMEYHNILSLANLVKEIHKLCFKLLFHKIFVSLKHYFERFNPYNLETSSSPLIASNLVEVMWQFRQRSVKLFIQRNSKICISFSLNWPIGWISL